MMRLRTANRAAIMAAVLCGMSGGAGLADDWPATMTIRGEERPVWPAGDLRDRGLDVADLDLKDNAARLYIEAINAFAEMPAELDDAFRSTLSDGLPRTAEGRLLVEWLTMAENRRAIEMAVEASKMEQCQFPYFGEPSASLMNVLLPSLSTYRQLAKIVTADGRRLDAEGKHDAALRNYVTTCRMGSHIAQGCTLIEALVGVACTALGVASIEDQVLAGDVQSAHMEMISNELDRLADQIPSTRRGLAGERHIGLSMVDRAFDNPLAVLGGIGNTDDLAMFGGQSEMRDSGWNRLLGRIGRLALPDRTIKGHMAAFYDEIDRRAQMPAFEAKWTDGLEDELLDRTVPHWNVISRMLLPSLSRANELSERLRAQFGMLRTATAIRLHGMHNHGVWPATLGDIIDEDDADTTIDPFSGKAFRYRREGDGWILYSLGENLSDDGGVEEEERNVPDMVLQFKPDRNQSNTTAQRTKNEE